MVGGVTPEILYAETPLTLHYNCFVFIHILPVSKPHSMLLYPAQGGWPMSSTVEAAITHSMNDAGSLMSVQFLRRAKIMGKKVMDGVIFASLLDATLRRRRSDRAPVMGDNDARGEDLEAVGGSLYLQDCSFFGCSYSACSYMCLLMVGIMIMQFPTCSQEAIVLQHRIKFGLGPDGKLRFPLINKTHMFSALRQYVSTGNPLWGLRPPHNAPTYDQQPHSTSFFSYKDPGNLSMAIFFLSWYSSILTSYANQVLSVASSTFSGGVSLFGKLPLLYP
ncbi:hypothetical protein Bca101_095909 [Brassica carinata]